jgi:prefoldin subunit 5
MNNFHNYDPYEVIETMTKRIDLLEHHLQTSVDLLEQVADTVRQQARQIEQMSRNQHAFMLGMDELIRRTKDLK